MSQPSGSSSLSDAAEQMRRAKGIYTWLWLSPLLTLPTLAFVSMVGNGLANIIPGWSNEDYQRTALVTALASVFISGLWHLILLVWALDRRSEFVRWHGRQALLLAGARTASALALAAVYVGWSSPWIFLAIVVLLALWFFGTLLAQQQVGQGKCTLMTWAGHGARLPLRGAAVVRHTGFDWGINLQNQGRQAEGALVFRQILVSDAPAAVKASAADRLPLPGETASAESADILVAMLRFSQDPARRQAALAALTQLGLVETL